MSMDVLAGRYELVRLMGRGGMAEVHRAYDRDLQRDVAVKILPQARRSEAADERLRDEARAGAALSHPHVATVFDVGISARGVFVVMELVYGRTWAQDLRLRGPVGEREAARVGSAVASALAHAHAHGVVHRDVCPRNVMLGTDDAPKLMDFGIAHVHGCGVEDEPGHVLGTAATISPEQARGRATGGRSDVYSLGCSLYEALTGTPPFEGGSSAAIARQRLCQAPPPLRRSAPTLSPAVEALVLRTLAVDPDDRPDAATLARELGDLAAAAPPEEDGDDGAAVPVAALAPRLRRAGTTALWFGLLTLVIVVVLALAG